MRTRWVGVVILVAAQLSISCKDEAELCEGEERCACYRTGTCNEGLECISDICVQADNETTVAKDASTDDDSAADDDAPNGRGGEPSEVDDIPAPEGGIGGESDQPRPALSPGDPLPTASAPNDGGVGGGESTSEMGGMGGEQPDSGISGQGETASSCETEWSEGCPLTWPIVFRDFKGIGREEMPEEYDPNGHPDFEMQIWS